MPDGGAIVDLLSCMCLTEEVAVTRAVVAVLWLVTVFEKSFENDHRRQAPFRIAFFSAVWYNNKNGRVDIPLQITI